MVGLGETHEEMVDAFGRLREHDVQVLTVGQYLRPTEKHLPVVRYWHPDEFKALERAAYDARLRPHRGGSAGALLLPRRRARQADAARRRPARRRRVVAAPPRGGTASRMRVRALLAAGAPAAAVALAGCGQKAAEYGGTAKNWPVRDLRIMAPAEPGGGWDRTARAMEQAIERGKVIDKNVEVYNVEGAGGTIGLAQLVSRTSRRANELMVMGLVMVGAIRTNNAPVDLTKVTPIA